MTQTSLTKIDASALRASPPYWRSLLGGVLSSLRRINRLFLLTVVLPTLVAVLYYGFIASDIFISESHFLVRGSERKAPSGVESLLQVAGGGYSISAEDNMSVADFMLSRDAIRRLDEEFDLRRRFGASDIDRLNRFAGLTGDDSFEGLFRYYPRRVSANAKEVGSPIYVLSVSAFAPADAHDINQRLLEMSEQLVNRLNERARLDSIQFAEAAVKAAENRARSASVAVSEYRHRQAVFNPELQSGLQLQGVTALQGQLSAARTRLDQIRSVAKDNPQIPPLERLLEATQAEIDAENRKVAGGQVSLAKKSVEYEALVLEQGLADKQLETALAALVQAQRDLESKRKYLERIVEPNLPDVALEPRRLRSILATLIFGFIAWGVLSLLVTGAKEHHG